MPLINPRLLKNKLTIADIPAQHLKILTAWRDSIQNRSLFSQKETALHSHFIQKILIEILGYQGFGGDESWTLSQEQKIGKGSVDVALGQFTTKETHILAPFELKGAKTKDLDAIMAGRHKSPVQQAWEYAMDAKGAKWVLVSNYLEIRLYAVGYGRQSYEKWDLAQLTDPLEYARLHWLLHADNLLSGATENVLQQSEQLDKEITQQLYIDYKTLRENLLNSLTTDNPDHNALDLIRHAQKILDRILFIAFAEDRDLLPDKTIEHAYQHNDPYNPRPVWANFTGLFNAIDTGNTALKIPAYNGGLFAPDAALDTLNVNDDICQAFKELAKYDFDSEVSVTVLGHIFEQSINDIEGLQAQARGENLDLKAVSKRKKHGVVYTPDHITRFIVEHTLGEHLRCQFTSLWDDMATHRTQKKDTWKEDYEIQFWRAYQDSLRATRVLDPACGSGAFLVAAFDFLQAEYSRINDVLADLTGTYDVFDLDKEILNKNLYGVDINAESIEITKLSLWLKTAKKGKQLNSLDDTIQVGNSVVADANYTDKPFDWAAFSAEGFDVILGNPPYVRQELISPIKAYLEQHYQVYNGVVDLYAYFFELGLRLLKQGGRMGYISSSTFFKTGSGENLRRFIMETASLENVVDFGDLQIFAGVTTYPAILTMRKQPADPQHQVRMLALGQKMPEDLDKQFSEASSLMSQTNLEIAAWRLEGDELLALRHKIVADKPTLKDVYGSPLYGIKTGFNEAFVIDRATRDDLVKADPKSAELIKPFLEGKDLKKWRVEGRGLSLILMPKGWTKQHIETDHENIAWQWLAYTYPAITTHLLPFAEKARKRTDKGDFWWELRACAYYAEFEQHKIIFSRFLSHTEFFLDTNFCYVNNALFILPNMTYFELGILNTNLAWLIIKSLATPLNGGFFQMQSKFFENFPIPNATAPQKQAIATLAESCQTTAESRYQKQDAIRRRIADLCPPEREAKLNNKLKSWWTLDFVSFRKEVKKVFKQDIPLQDRNDWDSWMTQERAEINRLSAELIALEKDLNAQVYTLFELTADEIKLLESNG